MAKRTTLLKLQQGMHRVTSGEFGPSIMHCDEDGTLSVTWKNGATETLAFVAGDDRDMGDVRKVEVLTGTFSFQNRL